MRPSRASASSNLSQDIRGNYTILHTYANVVNKYERTSPPLNVRRTEAGNRVLLDRSVKAINQKRQYG